MESAERTCCAEVGLCGASTSSAVDGAAGGEVNAAIGYQLENEALFLFGALQNLGGQHTLGIACKRLTV